MTANSTVVPQGADANLLAPSSRHALLILSKRAVRSASAVSSVVILVADAANAVSRVLKSLKLEEMIFLLD